MRDNLQQSHTDKQPMTTKCCKHLQPLRYILFLPTDSNLQQFGDKLIIQNLQQHSVQWFLFQSCPWSHPQLNHIAMSWRQSSLIQVAHGNKLLVFECHFIIFFLIFLKTYPAQTALSASYLDFNSIQYFSSLVKISSDMVHIIQTISYGHQLGLRIVPHVCNNR